MLSQRLSCVFTRHGHHSKAFGVLATSSSSATAAAAAAPTNTAMTTVQEMDIVEAKIYDIA